MTAFDQATLDRHGITNDEYARIVERLGREPNLTELGIFSVMWSEHCSYKSSRIHLKTLPTEGPRVLQGPGENAGAVDIGDGLAAVFKIESHNHPSFIEPYQGAATGVGGIIRDIFTMGARPIALLNALRFGPLDRPGVRRVLEGVVAGIAGYGNSIGIPTVGGEIGFDESYAGNPLVNVFCLGISKADEIVKGVAKGTGNPVYYVGAKTGRDGIHGATMASAEFDEKLDEKRPAVQVGDPFMEKLLLEACLEVMKSDALVGIQDMGAAGLTCSTCEMGARGGVGVEIDVSLVPQRETGMTPYEILLSESQERMLLVVKAGREREVEQIFEKWDLHAVRIGQVTADGLLRVKERGTVVAELPNRRSPTRRRCTTVRGASRPTSPPRARSTSPPCPWRMWRRTSVLRMSVLRFTPQRSSPCCPRPRSPASGGCTGQYDHMVRTNTLVLPGMGAGVVRVKGTRPRACDVGRRQRPVLLPRSIPWCAARRRRGRTERRVRRRASDWRDEQPEFRKSREAGHHVAARRSRAWHRRGVPLRSASRSPAATSASTTRPTAPPSCRRRCSGSSASSSTPTACSAASFPRDDAAIVDPGRQPGRARRERVAQGPPRPSEGRRARTRPRASRAASNSSWSSPRPIAQSSRLTTAPRADSRVALAECCFDTGGRGAVVDVPARGDGSSCRASNQCGRDALRRVCVACHRLRRSRPARRVSFPRTRQPRCRRTSPGGPAGPASS